MDMKKRVNEIQDMDISNVEKIKLLKEILADCQGEMDAQEQNMNPQIEHNLAECYRKASDYLRELENKLIANN
ncbi:MAG: hypothetical protein A3E88_05210 [Legionellales bacterium RIFCSPHIGHO2_12_FULL_35_11]|nr:MAG: hypothetical protein A3E88_05210 [Legionellales bacterium RIFCSPHIGHO2_12_FULL_35_11]